MEYLKEYSKYEIEENFGTGYKLVLNPLLTFHGEVLLFTSENHSYINTSDSKMIIQDVGRIPSLRTIKYEEEMIQLLKSMNINVPHLNPNDNNYSTSITNLNSNLFNLSTNQPPLGEQDVYSMLNGIKSIEGVAILRILPYKYADSKYFGSSMIKILKLPLKDINYKDLPLSLKVEQTVKDLKRQKMKELVNTSKISEKELKIDNLIQNEEFTHYFELNDYFKIESLSENGIQHMVKSYTQYNLNTVTVLNDLKNIFRELKINNETGYGFNLILSKDYLFVAPLVNPFIVHINIPIFAEPHFFMGIFTLPLIEAEWPETIKGKYVNYEFGEVLRKSTSAN